MFACSRRIHTGDPLHSRALVHSRAPLFTQPCPHCSHSRAPGEQLARLCVFTLQGCVQAARLCRGSLVIQYGVGILFHHQNSNSIETSFQCNSIPGNDITTNFAHGTTAQTSCPVQNLVVIGYISIWIRAKWVFIGTRIVMEKIFTEMGLRSMPFSAHTHEQAEYVRSRHNKNNYDSVL